MDEEKLKPCPCSCCGNSEIELALHLPIDGGLKHFVDCKKCNTRSSLENTEEKAIRAWNNKHNANHCKKCNGSDEKGGETPAGEKPA